MNVDALSFISLAGDADDAEFHSAVVSKVHSHNSAQASEEGRLGIHFVGKSDARLFGTAAALQHFSNQPQVRRLASRIRVTPPVAVPAGAPLVRVARNNAIDREKPSYRARCHTYGRRSAELKADIRSRAAADTVVYLRSRATEQDFKLVVKATPLPAESPRVARFNNYGLCLEGGVPAF